MSRGTINFGHGKKSNGTFDPGAIGASGLKESDVVKAVGTIVVSELQRLGHNINAIQNGDLWAVVDSSDNFNSEWFVSIHNNSHSDKTAHGIETHVSALGADAEKLAKAIQSNLISDTGLTNRGIKVTGLYVNKYTKCPSCLVELPFISNPTEEKLLASPEFQRKCAISIVKGIQQYLGLEYVTEKTIQSTNNNQGVNDMLDVCVLLYSKEDYWSGTDVAEKNGNCAIFIRPADKSVPKGAMNSKKLIVVGGSKTGHKNELLLSGNDKYDTANKVHQYLQGK